MTIVFVERYGRGEAEILQEKPVPLPVYRLKIPPELAWDWTRASATRIFLCIT